MKDRISTKILENGAIRYGIYDEAGNLLRYEYIRSEDEPTEPGSAINKANLLPDDVAAALALTQPNPQVKDALARLSGAALLKPLAARVEIGTIPDGSIFVVEGAEFRKVATNYHAPNTVTLWFAKTVSSGITGNAGQYSGSNIDNGCVSAFNLLPDMLKELALNVTLSDVSITRKCFSFSRSELNGGIPYFNSNARRNLGTGYYTRTFAFYQDYINYYNYVQNGGGLDVYGNNYPIAPGFVIPASLSVYLQPNGAYSMSPVYSLVNVFGGAAPLPYAKIATGSYTGTGTFGSGSKNSLTASFLIKLAFVVGRDNWRSEPIVLGSSRFMSLTSLSMTGDCFCEWIGNTIRWYSSDSTRQLNASGTVYDYVIVGL